MTRWSIGNNTKLLLLFKEGKADPSNLNQKPLKRFAQGTLLSLHIQTFLHFTIKSVASGTLSRHWQGSGNIKGLKVSKTCFCVLSDHQMECKHCLCCLPIAAAGETKTVNQEAKQKLNKSDANKLGKREGEQEDNRNKDYSDKEDLVEASEVEEDEKVDERVSTLGTRLKTLLMS